jgi:hypothetical protein
MPDEDPWEARYERSESAETSETSKSAETAETSDDSETTVRERTNINMYLPEEVVDDLQLRYSELNVEWRRAHGEDLPKNAEFYPAVIRAALDDTTVRAELGFDEPDR